MALTDNCLYHYGSVWDDIPVVTHARPLRRRLPAQPSSVGEARRLVRQSLADAGRGDLVETAELLVSEVVTNALLHAGTPIDVALSVKENGLFVEVGDGSPHLPSRRSYAAAARTGRGLLMLEQMVNDWGVLPNPPGKTVWFHVTSGDHDESDLTSLERTTETASLPLGETVSVTLLNVPLLLHAAWEEHAQALLREYLLANLDPDFADEAIREHAEATDAIAVLAQRIPRPGVRMAPNELMSDAVEPRVSSPRVDVLVAHESVRHFRTLDQTLRKAITLAEDDLLLTPPAQPELQSYRRWLCRQVDQQSRGGTSSPWPAEADPPSAARGALSWDASPVTESARAMIAADDENLILAASRSALDLLGYDEQAQLVGQRIVAIIPTRYRQAHIAGFTLHLLVGRSPLIGKTVVVPALRRDGSEVVVELTVRSESVPQGRKVFLAELREAAP
jgi:PAS domain S-box-containing protein